MKPDYKKLFYRKVGQHQITLEIMEEKAKTVEAMTKSMEALAKSMEEMSQAFTACVLRLKEIQKEDTDKFDIFEDEE